MGILIFWLLLAVIVGIAANARGRNGAAWFLIAVVISPLLGLVLVLVMPDLRTAQAGVSSGVASGAASGALPGGVVPAPGEERIWLRDCPHCAEPIRAAAQKCKHCGSAVTPLLKPGDKLPMGEIQKPAGQDW